MKFELPKLPYAYDALEPFIDARTMEIHHTKHHQGYVDKLNLALEKYPELFEKSAEDLLFEINQIPQEIRQAVINHGGGHSNHSLFWTIMEPNGGVEPTGILAEAVNKEFGNLTVLKDKLTNAGLNRFGSGWAWLVVNNGKLEVYSTANQDSPLMERKMPILGIDVWEHSYYLRYFNRRDEYLKNWWHVVSWRRVEANYSKALKK